MTTIETLRKTPEEIKQFNLEYRDWSSSDQLHRVIKRAETQIVNIFNVGVTDQMVARQLVSFLSVNLTLKGGCISGSPYVVRQTVYFKQGGTETRDYVLLIEPGYGLYDIDDVLPNPIPDPVNCRCSDLEIECKRKIRVIRIDRTRNIK